MTNKAPNPKRKALDLKGLTPEERTLKIQEVYPELEKIMDLKLLHKSLDDEYLNKLRAGERAVATATRVAVKGAKS